MLDIVIVVILRIRINVYQLWHTVFVTVIAIVTSIRKFNDAGSILRSNVALVRIFVFNGLYTGLIICIMSRLFMQ